MKSSKFINEKNSSINELSQLNTNLYNEDNENLLKSNTESPSSWIQSNGNIEKCNQELIQVKNHLNSVQQNYKRLKVRFRKLHADYFKLLNIVKTLTSSLENSACGEPIDLIKILQSCRKIYPELFISSHEDSNEKLNSTGIKLDNLDIKIKRSMLNPVPLSPKDLNYKEIKNHLISSNNIKTKLLLLQALRWKITLSQLEERDEVIKEYIKNDLLSLNKSNSEKSILPYLLIPLNIVVPHPLQQSAARLLNAFASLKCGRDYLAVGPTILNIIVQCLDGPHVESFDPFACDMIIAVLQKLSLRKNQRLYMITSGLVEWLIYHLRAECQSMTTYRLEYSTALLMNLSLHKEAQVRAAVIANTLISTLIVLLSSDHLPAMPYVNGALLNFITNAVINEEAKKIGLKSILEYHRKQRYGELRKHLDYILQRHTQKFSETIEETVDNDDDENDGDDVREDLDVLEDELDEMDPVKVNPGELFGETLLITYYSVKTDDKLPKIESKSKDEFVSHAQTINLDDKIEKNSNAFTQINHTKQFRESCKSISEDLKDLNVDETYKLNKDPTDTVEIKMSTVPSLPVILLGKEDGRRENVGRGGGEEAFVAKPRISRTPPPNLIPEEAN